jgi:hypothetical protein
VAIVDTNFKVGIAKSGTQYFTFQTATSVQDVALYTDNPSPQFYFVGLNGRLYVWPGYGTVYTTGGTLVTNAAYVATNINGNVAYVDNSGGTSGGLHYSGNGFGTGQAFTTVLSSGVIRVGLSPTRLWYIDTNRDAWYVDLDKIVTSSFIKSSGTSCYEISAGKDETAAVSVDPTQNYAVFLYDKTNPSPTADGQFTKKVSTAPTAVPNGALDIGVYDATDAVFIDPTDKDVVYTNSF